MTVYEYPEYEAHAALVRSTYERFERLHARLEDLKAQWAQLNIEASGSGAKRYHLGSKLATFEIGGRFRNAHKFNDGYVLTLTPDATALTNSAQFSSGFIPMTTFPNAIVNHNYYGANYNLGYQPSFENTFSFYQANPTLFDSSSTQDRVVLLQQREEEHTRVRN